MMPSPVDKSLYIFLGSEGVNWITQDCGKNIKAIDQGRPIHEFIFHPTEKNWVLASAWTKCDDPTQENCKTFKELFFSDNLCENWKLLTTYVVQFQWAYVDFSFTNFVPKERIIVSHEANAKGNQKLSGWSEKIQVSQSDDFFKTPAKVIVPKGNKFLITKGFFFVVQVSDEALQDVLLLVGPSKKNVYELNQVTLPNQRLREHSYTILDTTEGQVFLHINHEGQKSIYGTIYISDSSGAKYSMALPGNVRNYDGQCDFEKVQGVEGVYLANVYDKDQLKRVKNSLENSDSQIPQEKSTGKKTQPSPYKRDALKEDNVNAMLVDFKKTMISFNKGSMWNYLIAPNKDSNDKKIVCNDIDSCSLHLHSISNTRFGPFYSTENSLGIVIGTGNVGSHLANREDEINTYLSRDAGLSWFEIKKGSHIYEIGDHGSIIVIAPDQAATDVVFYSWNEGLTWQNLTISEDPVEITNIITEPSNKAEKFIIYGRSVGKSSKSTSKGVVIAIDFMNVHQRWCERPDKPDTDGSDYELWTPNGRISPQCLMGHKTTYVRRKRDAACFNNEEWDRWYYFEICQCTEEDWECDVGFSRKDNGPCTSENGTDTKIPPPPPETCNGYYDWSQGYRKIAGDTCKGGVNHDPIKIPCPGFSSLSRSNLFILIALFIIIVGLILANNSGALSRFKDMFGGGGAIKSGGGKAGRPGFKQLGKDNEGEEGASFNDLFFDNDHDDHSADPVDDKSLIDMTKKKEKKYTGGNALEMAKKNVPKLSQPGQDTNLMEFNPRS
jgi:hypothetical protein